MIYFVLFYFSLIKWKFIWDKNGASRKIQNTRLTAEFYRLILVKELQIYEIKFLEKLINSPVTLNKQIANFKSKPWNHLFEYNEIENVTICQLCPEFPDHKRRFIGINMSNIKRHLLTMHKQEAELNNVFLSKRYK